MVVQKIRKSSSIQACAKVPKRSEILGSLSPRSGTLMDLGPCTSFLPWDSGNPGPQNCDMPQDPGTQDLKILICSETLETQDLKILTVARPWKPRTLKFGYVAKPWKPRTRNLKILMSQDLKVLGPTPFNTEFHAEHFAREFNR